MNRTAFKFAASTMIVSLTMVDRTAQSVAMRRAARPSVPICAPTAQAAQLHEQAGRAHAAGPVRPGARA